MNCRLESAVTESFEGLGFPATSSSDLTSPYQYSKLYLLPIVLFNTLRLMHFINVCLLRIIILT